jgi:GrpB-like predicted nucleotidyltransferase (UPF0157 family)
MGDAPVELVAHDVTWALTFDALRAVYAAALGPLACAIEHVGSTAVPGLVAKPILDIDVVARDAAEVDLVVARLCTLGYRHKGDQGIAGREALGRDGQEDVPRDGTGRWWPAHHLYVCAPDARELARHLHFRDRLRAEPETAAAYGRLKQALAVRYRFDRTAYGDGKSAFVEAVLAGMDIGGSASADRP